MSDDDRNRELNRYLRRLLTIIAIAVVLMLSLTMYLWFTGPQPP